MKENNQLAERLRERNLKATSTRMKVLSVISEYHHAIPFSEIQKALQGFDRVTLYRSLHAMIESGIIHKALVDEKETFYALCKSGCSTNGHNHQHIHFKCSNCDAVTCVQADDPVQLSIQGHSIESIEIDAIGICASCKN